MLNWNLSMLRLQLPKEYHSTVKKRLWYLGSIVTRQRSYDERQTCACNFTEPIQTRTKNLSCLSLYLSVSPCSLTQGRYKYTIQVWLMNSTMSLDSSHYNLIDVVVGKFTGDWCRASNLSPVWNMPIFACLFGLATVHSENGALYSILRLCFVPSRVKIYGKVHLQISWRQLLRLAAPFEYA